MAFQPLSPEALGGADGHRGRSIMVAELLSARSPARRVSLIGNTIVIAASSTISSLVAGAPARRRQGRLRDRHVVISFPHHRLLGDHAEGDRRDLIRSARAAARVSAQAGDVLLIPASWFVNLFAPAAARAGIRRQGDGRTQALAGGDPHAGAGIVELHAEEHLSIF